LDSWYKVKEVPNVAALVVEVRNPNLESNYEFPSFFEGAVHVWEIQHQEIEDCDGLDFSAR
jgi:hypothetical protein